MIVPQSRATNLHSRLALAPEQARELHTGGGESPERSLSSLSLKHLRYSQSRKSFVHDIAPEPHFDKDWTLPQTDKRL